MKTMAEGIMTRVAAIGADTNDDDDVRLRKSILVFCSLPFVFAGFGWGALYFAFDEWLAGSILFTYGIFSALSILYLPGAGNMPSSASD